MTGTLSLKQLTLDVWLLEQLRQAPAPGLTLEELKTRWTENPSHEGVLGRTTLTRHRQMIEEFFGVVIHTPDKKHYCIKNPEQLALDTLANDLLASVQEYLFLDEYRDLGSAIQPQQIWAGLDYLRPIGEALRHGYKLHVRYQKFTDAEPYEAILHPYCLKADKGRWYLLAHKETSELDVQVFALDRMTHLTVMETRFERNPEIDPATYFRDCFGVWRDYERYPVHNLYVVCTERVGQYLRTLPLHHSQKECHGDVGNFRFPDSKHVFPYMFFYRISLSPDFIGELCKWDGEIRIIQKSEIKKEEHEPMGKYMPVDGTADTVI